MTGSIVEKTTKAGTSYLYIRLNYKDARTKGWKQKWIPTGLISRGNKKQAKAMLPGILGQYAYLEYQEEDINPAIDRNILLTDYMDLWIHNKKKELETSTYEGYVYRVTHIKEYFKAKN